MASTSHRAVISRVFNFSFAADGDRAIVSVPGDVALALAVVTESIAGAIVLALFTTLARIAVVPWGAEACTIQTEAGARAQVATVVARALLRRPAIWRLFSTRGTEAATVLANPPPRAGLVLEDRATNAFRAGWPFETWFTVTLGSAYLADTMAIAPFWAFDLGGE